MELKPIFIGGCPRSGTTLLGAMLGAHTDCVCVPESLFKTDVLRGLDKRAAPHVLLDRVIESDGFKVWALDEQIPDTNLTSPPPASYSDVLLSLVARYARVNGRAHARVWVDHTPYNTRHGATLSALFPAARFIHIVRDGRAVASSVLPLDWGPNTVERAARWWAELVAFGLGLESWGGARVLRVRYEDLVTEPEAALRAITRFAALDYQPGMLRADGLRFPPGAGQNHRLIGTPPQTLRADAWQSELTDRQVELFEFQAGDLLRYLGYEPRFGVCARPASLLERFTSLVVENARERLVNRRRFRRRLRRTIRAAQKHRRQ